MVKSNFKVPSISTTTASTVLPATVRTTRAYHAAPKGELQPKAKVPFNRHFAWEVAPNLLISFRYAWAGVRYAFVTQRNFRIHTAMGLAALSLGLALQLLPVELAILALTSALVMVLELLNTALESVVDLAVGQSYHELAKIAKDCAAGAVMISAVAAVFVASFLIVPPLWLTISTVL
jgi:diacylglycerol kinase (ATP)